MKNKMFEINLYTYDMNLYRIPLYSVETESIADIVENRYYGRQVANILWRL